MSCSHVVGLLAAACLALEIACLPRLQWLDAWVVGSLDGGRGCHPGGLASLVTRTAPYLAGAFVAIGVLAAHARGGRRRDIPWVLGLLALALLLVEALKLFVARDRPGAVPWVTRGASFPSGHVADAALGVAAALRLAGREDRGDPLVMLLGAAGIVFVAGIAFTRVYLGRHWPTDVTASVLLALCFWSATFLPHSPAGFRVVAVAVVAVFGLYAARAAGVRVRLSSPTTLEEDLELASIEKTWIPATPHRARGFFRLAGNELRFRLHVGSGSPALLKIVARGLGKPKAPQCRSIDLLVDGAVVSSRPLRMRWRSYAFALPLPAGGMHEVAVRASHAPHRTLAFREVEIEGADSAVAVSSRDPADAPGREVM